MKRFSFIVLFFCVVQFVTSSAYAEPRFVRQTPGTTSVIVFIHGVLGNGSTSWKNENGKDWPSMLTEDTAFRGYDIFVHDYPTTLAGSSFSISELAENARLIFEAQGVSDYQDIVFVAHSMGGLVLRAYLLRYRPVAEKTRLIYFFSTPSTGSEIASLAGLFSSSPQLFAMKPMDRNATGYLSDLLRDWLAADLKIPSFCAYEKQPTYGVMVVTLASASNLCNKRLDPVQADHINIVKPSGKGDVPYLALSAAMRAVPSKKTSCAPTLDRATLAVECGLSRDDAKRKTVNTIADVKNKLALILSQKEMFLFPTFDTYIRNPTDTNWERVKTETTELLKLVREAMQGILQFDASLRPELGLQGAILAEPDGIRQVLSLIAVQDLRARGNYARDILAASSPTPEAAREFKSKLQGLVEQLSTDLAQLSRKVEASL
ncbi:alpha/beta hydrolase [Bradyrhizobium diazoefficiens]|nr:alpha/beta hydrolase [Bradyrhizobium diazoefficiens]MBR0814887.1 alpha/beta hydrolase [Bradyrhizobium diazoefficiens]